MPDILKNIFGKVDISTFRLPKIGFNSLLDILIVSFLAYQVIFWIKETRAWVLLKGIAVVLIVALIAYVFRLFALVWIINNTFSVGVTVIIVIFQPELRRMLEKIGKGRIIESLNLTGITADTGHSSLTEKSVNEICESCIKMAETRTGAIIMIERAVSLSDLEQTGIPVDAAITSQLMMNIFVDKTPLHDGAVIVKNNRIAAASCILPLTSREVASELGTRHRASIGASEVTDAYIIVCSEETGAISIAHNGHLERAVTKERFEKVLMSLVIRSDKKKRFGVKKKGRAENE